MNPLLWLVFAGLFWLFCNWSRVRAAVRGRLHVIRCLEDIAGPPALPLVGIAHKLNPDSVLTTYIMEYFFRSYTDTKKADGVMKLWLGPKPVVVLYRPETVKPILDSHILVQKPNDYDYLKDWLGEGLLTSTNPKWHSRRKMLTPAFHFNILDNFMHVFNEEGNILMSKLDKEAESGYPFDLYPSLKAVALDVICEAAMGVKMGSQTGRNTEYVRSVKVMCELLWLRIRSPWLWPRLCWALSGRGPRFQRALKVVTGFTEAVISERKRDFQQTNNNNNNTEDERQKPAFLDILLRMQAERGLSDAEIREEVDTFMFEGHDTVSNTLSFFLFLLGDQRQLHFQDKIHAELMEIFGDDPTRDVTKADLGRMKYLEQCIKEGMRMVPVVPMVGRIALHDLEIAGHTVPKGVTVMISPFLVHRNKNYWKEPNEFDPSHFDAEETRRRHPFAYVPFSAGARNCIGQKFAMHQMKVVLGKLLLRYRVVGHVHEVENRGLPELVMKPNGGCVVRLEWRQPGTP